MRRVSPTLSLLVLLVQLACERSAPPPTPPPAVIARVVELQGEVLRDGRPLALGDAVALSESIEVRSGRLVLELPGKGQLRLFPHTRVKLIDGERLQLWLGRVWAVIEAAVGTRYAVETDNAVAGVRGTEFIVAASAAETEVAVLDGVVEVSHKQHPAAPTTVRRGQKTVVAAAAPPAAPVVYDPDEGRRQWEAPDQVPPPVPQPGPGVAPPPPERRPPGRAPLSPLEREGERTKEELRREGEQTKEELRREEGDTRRRLEESEAATKKRLEDEARRIREGREPEGRGGVKDFLE